MSTLQLDYKYLILSALLAIGAIVTASVPPIPQDPTFHLFADTRGCFGIPNFGDVVTNLGFAAVGILGLWGVTGEKGRRTFDKPSDAWPYIAFFIGVTLVSIGSAYYHAEPTNERLFWDRLPMTIGFMTFCFAIMADRIPGVAPTYKWLLPAMINLGGVSLIYWVWSEGHGTGDLRLYGFVQYFPMIALPIVLWMFPKGRYTTNMGVVWVIGWYALSKILEFYDHEIFALLGQTMSGHSIKHLISAVAPLVVWKMLRSSALAKTTANPKGVTKSLGEDPVLRQTIN